MEDKEEREKCIKKWIFWQSAIHRMIFEHAKYINYEEHMISKQLRIELVFRVSAQDPNIGPISFQDYTKLA